jgi:hypothetical protein
MNALWRMHAVSSGVKEEDDELVLNAFKGRKVVPLELEWER